MSFQSQIVRGARARSPGRRAPPCRARATRRAPAAGQPARAEDAQDVPVAEQRATSPSAASGPARSRGHRPCRGVRERLAAGRRRRVHRSQPGPLRRGSRPSSGPRSRRSRARAGPRSPPRPGRRARRVLRRRPRPLQRAREDGARRRVRRAAARAPPRQVARRRAAGGRCGRVLSRAAPLGVAVTDQQHGGWSGAFHGAWQHPPTAPPPRVHGSTAAALRHAAGCRRSGSLSGIARAQTPRLPGERRIWLLLAVF